MFKISVIYHFLRYGFSFSSPLLIPYFVLQSNIITFYLIMQLIFLLFFIKFCLLSYLLYFDLFVALRLICCTSVLCRIPTYLSYLSYLSPSPINLLNNLLIDSPNTGCMKSGSKSQSGSSTNALFAISL